MLTSRSPLAGRERNLVVAPGHRDGELLALVDCDFALEELHRLTPIGAAQGTGATAVASAAPAAQDWHDAQPAKG